VGSRKAILCTNIAETSLTVNGIGIVCFELIFLCTSSDLPSGYVVDGGYTKQKNYNSVTGIESLEVVRISKVSADQRRGRAGRTREGKCFRIYEEGVYNGEGVPIEESSSYIAPSMTVKKPRYDLMDEGTHFQCGYFRVTHI